MINLKSNNLKSKLDPNWVTGFVDAEGCFHMSIYSDNLGSKLKWRITPAFQIGLHVKDIDLLLQIKSYFNNVGKICRNKNNSINYQIRDINSIITILIPHFDKYPLLTQKQADYILFKEIIKLIKDHEHLTDEGMNKILNLKASLNNGVSDNILSHFPDIQKVQRVKVNLPKLINYNWLAGFFSGDGCFFINISKAKSCVIGSSVKLNISITQHLKDETLMLKIVETIGCGNVYRHSQEAVAFKVFAFKDICDVIIPLFKEYPVKGTKSLDFKDFCIIAEMVKQRLHLTSNGFLGIKKIKSGMNKNRLI